MSGESEKSMVPVLIVEDADADVEIIRRAFRQGKIANPLHVVHDGEEALEFLTHTGRYAQREKAPMPGLILLDLNLPRLNGHEVLRRIKVDSALKRIPVVVLTASRNDTDIRQCCSHGANAYLTKPLDFQEFLKGVFIVAKEWLSPAVMPGACGKVAAS